MRVAAIQMNSGSDVTANLALADRLLAEAAREKCVLAVLPENFALMPERGTDKAKHAEQPGLGPIQDCPPFTMRPTTQVSAERSRSASFNIR